MVFIAECVEDVSISRQKLTCVIIERNCTSMIAFLSYGR